jgi:hypothetical protein
VKISRKFSQCGAFGKRVRAPNISAGDLRELVIIHQKGKIKGTLKSARAR